MVKVSVIIPVYNVENYLRECLDSVCNQTFEDIEIICINDGSTDNSQNILEEYAKKDNRFIIVSQENKGQGAGRNKGLSIAKGEYILFVDSDDYIELNSINELVSIADNDDLDLIIFKLINFYDETKKIFQEEYHEMPILKNLVGDNIFNYKDIVDFVINMDVTVYTKFFKKDLISSIRFNEDLIFEDNLFTMEYIFHAKKCYFYDKHLYHRRIRENSTITSHSKEYVDVIEIFNLIIEKIKKLNLYDIFKEKLFVRKIQVILMRFNLIDEQFKEYFFSEIKKDFLDKKDEYEKDINFDLIDDKNKSLFENVIRSSNYTEFELKNNEFDKQNINKDDLLKIYETARIDLKNTGGVDNTIEIINNSDKHSNVYFADFLKQDNGNGCMIKSSEGNLELLIKIIHDGQLVLSLRGMNVFDVNNNQFPVYIDYLSLEINNDEILTKNMLVCHNYPVIFRKEVKNNEIIKINVKWLPFNQFSDFFNSEKLLKEKVENLVYENNCLNEKIINLKRKNKELKNKIKKIN